MTDSRARRAESADGTQIAYRCVGSGRPVVIVGGAFATAEAGGPLAAALADAGLQGVTYDRRGRGDSADTAPYAPEREAEDLSAVIDAVGDAAVVFDGRRDDRHPRRSPARTTRTQPGDRQPNPLWSCRWIQPLSSLAAGSDSPLSSFAGVKAKPPPAVTLRASLDPDSSTTRARIQATSPHNQQPHNDSATPRPS
jgi:hypothetical protein